VDNQSICTIFADEAAFVMVLVTEWPQFRKPDWKRVKELFSEPVMIKNLAEDLIKLSGFTPYEDIDIVYTGLRPGEKLFEELLTAEEGTIPSPHEKIFIANQNGIDESFCEKLNYLLKVAHEGDVEEIIATIKSIVPNFRVDNEKVTPADRITITNI